MWDLVRNQHTSLPYHNRPSIASLLDNADTCAQSQRCDPTLTHACSSAHPSRMHVHTVLHTAQFPPDHSLNPSDSFHRTPTQTQPPTNHPLHALPCISLQPGCCLPFCISAYCATMGSLLFHSRGPKPASALLLLHASACHCHVFMPGAGHRQPSMVPFDYAGRPPFLFAQPPWRPSTQTMLFPSRIEGLLPKRQQGLHSLTLHPPLHHFCRPSCCFAAFASVNREAAL